MDDRILAMCELSGDLLFHKIPRQRYGYYVDSSLAAGRRAAQAFAGRDIQSLYRENAIEICRKDSGKGSYGVILRGQAVMSRTGCSVEVYQDSIRTLAENTGCTEAQALDIHLAHEFFHFWEYRSGSSVVETLDPVVTMTVLRWQRKARIHRCGEIAAHAFAKTLLGLAELPNYYDYLYLVNTGKMTRQSLEDLTARMGRLLEGEAFMRDLPQNYRVYQRNPLTKTGQVTVSLDAPGDVRVQTWAGAAVTAWQSLRRADDGWKAELTVPQGGWYRLALRREGQVTALDARWGVGVNILCIGQSNMVGQGEPPYTPADDRAACFRCGAWAHLEDPYAGEGASLVPSMANELIRALDIPVGVIPAADTGSGLHQANIGFEENRYWMYYRPENPATLYGYALAATCGAGGAELAVWNQGETDGRLLIPKDVYKTDMKTLLTRLRRDLAVPELPLFLCQIGTHATNISNDRDYTAIRTAQTELDDGENFYLAATEMEFPRKDTAHYTTPALDEIGRRVANAILCHYGLRRHYRGPAITGCRWEDEGRTSALVTVAHRGGGDIATRGEITGFSLISRGRQIPVTARRAGPNAIRLTLAQPGEEGAVLRYLYGLEPPHHNIAKDDSPLALPLENTTEDIPILP